MIIANRSLLSAAVIATALLQSGVATAATSDAKKFKFLIPVDSSLDAKPMRSSFSQTTPSVAAPKLASPIDSGSSSSASESAAAASAPTAQPMPKAPVAAVMSSTQRTRFLQGIDRALANDTRASLTILNSLKGETLPADERDRLMLAIARVQYQAGDDVGALESYNSVRKGSASWLESLEERAWANMRLGRPQEALASLKTVLTPVFVNRTSSEPYFLASLAQLRVCDYEQVFKTLDLFKTRFRPRVSGWENSSDPVDKARLRETSDTIQKLNLVEAEAIQRLYIDESGKRMGGSVPKIQRDKNQLTFPMDSEVDQKEVWLDEVDDYRVTVKGCPQPSLERVAKKEGSL